MKYIYIYLHIIWRVDGTLMVCFSFQCDSLGCRFLCCRVRHGRSTLREHCCLEVDHMGAVCGYMWVCKFPILIKIDWSTLRSCSTFWCKRDVFRPRCIHSVWGLVVSNHKPRLAGDTRNVYAAFGGLNYAVATKSLIDLMVVVFMIPKRVMVS